MYPDMFSLTGRTALVTGSSRGIGFALARALGQAGATVVLNARDRAALEIAAGALEEEGLAVEYWACDITDDTAVASMIDGVEDVVGPIDILVNNAGMQRRGSFVEFPLEELRALVELNLIAAFVVGQSVAARMVPRGAGKIVNICSVQAQLARPSIAAYTATKGGLRLLTNGMCADLAGSGIQVNGIAPGYFETDLTRPLVDDDAFSSWLCTRTPAGRWGHVEELAGAVVFFASSASDFVNGQTLFVDGGVTAVL